MATKQISTTRFGVIDVDVDELIDLPDGLLGFVSVDQVALVPVDQDGLFFWMQAVNDPAVAFLVLTPWPLFADYELDLAEADQEALGIDHAGDAIVFCLLTSHDKPRRFTANLLGPVVINRKLRKGRQVVLNGDHPTQAELPGLGSGSNGVT